METVKKPSQYLNEAEAAAYLELPQTTLAGWRRATSKSKLAFIKMGGKIRYRQSDLDAFIEKSMHNGDNQ